MTSTLVRRFIPPTDILELPDRLHIVVEIAGIQQGDVSITVVNRSLIISGVRHRHVEQHPIAHHRVEIGYGEFRLQIPLPWAVEPDRVTAIYQDGFLQIDLPRRLPRTVNVNDSGVQNHSETIDHDVTEIE